ncbi:lysophospholipid acyltransferase family protein [Streptacidiphilus albus]|uniref:lysophospholipid acyltransferase family protein n=1 Tax=Streptacidiphilus albus TaxID=105425 RepID=UPI00054BC738|nr:lysophospholipid acyltransferase family protein [Streptacidiphilus albus]
MKPDRLRTAARRLATVPALVVLTPVAVAGFAVCLLLTGPVSLLLRGAWRPVRLSGFLVLYLAAELVGLALSVADLFGPRGSLRARSYARLGSLLAFLCRAAVPVFGLRVEVTGERPPASAPLHPDRPLLVLARHAGPGDSFLLVHVLITHVGLRPRVVLKQALRLDPCLDVLLGRVPHCFVPRNAAPRHTTAAIGALVSDMGPRDALVIFPEGGNFTERRRRLAIRWLRRHGRPHEAARSERLSHVLPPRTDGTLAALAAAPSADVVFVAHTGLDDMVSVRTLWQGIPLRRTVRASWWRVASEDVPAEAEQQADWLRAQWARVDSWIDGRS